MAEKGKHPERLAVALRQATRNILRQINIIDQQYQTGLREEVALAGRLTRKQYVKAGAWQKKSGKRTNDQPYSPLSALLL